ncbi:MAG: hypothetical protein DWH73_00425 [Planctomycetota bacterium]|nr:MAG: hypothetical protein DWH73_00425 [Planctomycetota bacterium]
MRAIGRFQPRRKHLVMLVSAPFVFWILVVGLMPTMWLAHRMESAVERLTGLPAHVNRLRLTLTGGVIVDGLQLGPVEELEESSQLHIRKVLVNVDWLSVLTGRLAMTDIALVGVEGRLARSPDGSWLPERWLKPIEMAESQWAQGKAKSWLVDVEIRGGRLEIADPAHRSKILITGLVGLAEAGEGYFKMPELVGKVDGGDLMLAVSADQSHEVPIFDANLGMRNVPLGVHFDVLGFICPLLAGEDVTPKGRMDLELYLQGRLEKDWASTLKGRGNLKLDPVSAEGLPLAQRLGINTLVAEINGVQHRAEDLTLRITNPFTIQSRRVSSPALRVEVGPIPLKFEGWTDFDGRLDYVIRTDVIRDQLPVGMRGVLDDLKPQEEALAIRGRLDALTILVNDQPITTEGYQIRKSDLRNNLEQISRRFSERLAR